MASVTKPLPRSGADLKQRREAGRCTRRDLKRSQHAAWDPKARKHDPIDVVLTSTYGRISHLVPLKMVRMAASPFGFFRGSVPLFAADMATLPNTGIMAQMCGDAHVRNLGAFAGPDGRLVFDINDFDETMHGPLRVGPEASGSEPGARRTRREELREGLRGRGERLRFHLSPSHA